MTGSSGNAAARRFWQSATFSPSDMWWGEWVAIVLGAGGGVILAIREPGAVGDIVTAASALAGVVIGGVLAGMAILTSGLDSAFLKKLTGIDIKAEQYLAPFLATSMISILAVVFLFVWAAVDNAHNALAGVVGGVSGALVLWAIASLVPALGTLVHFIGLRQDSS